MFCSLPLFHACFLKYSVLSVRQSLSSRGKASPSDSFPFPAHNVYLNIERYSPQINYSHYFASKAYD